MWVNCFIWKKINAYFTVQNKLKFSSVLCSNSWKIFFSFSADISRFRGDNRFSDCNCAKIFEAVCGSDGETYPTECYLNCIREKSNPELKLLNEGECEPCFCPKLSKIVCGSDGITYSNKCELNCARRYNFNLSIFKKGECLLETTWLRPQRARR